MVKSVLTVCTGNICRSPLAAMALAEASPDLQVSSAGLHAMVGWDMDPEAQEAAAAVGVTVTPHAARQFDTDIGNAADVILVMERHHRNEIVARWPQFTGKTFLLGHFEKGKEIPDPYRMGSALHLRAAELIRDSVGKWTEQLDALR